MFMEPENPLLIWVFSGDVFITIYSTSRRKVFERKASLESLIIFPSSVTSYRSRMLSELLPASSGMVIRKSDTVIFGGSGSFETQIVLFVAVISTSYSWALRSIGIQIARTERNILIFIVRKYNQIRQPPQNRFKNDVMLLRRLPFNALGTTLLLPKRLGLMSTR